MCDAGVTTFCEKTGTLQCWWSAVFLLTRAKQRWRKALLTVKSSQKKLQPASAAAAPSRAPARGREWRQVKAFRCNRTSIKRELRNQRAVGPSDHTKRARGGRKAHRNQAAQKQKHLQKIRREDEPSDFDFGPDASGGRSCFRARRRSWSANGQGRQRCRASGHRIFPQAWQVHRVRRKR